MLGLSIVSPQNKHLGVTNCSCNWHWSVLRGVLRAGAGGGTGDSLCIWIEVANQKCDSPKRKPSSQIGDPTKGIRPKRKPSSQIGDPGPNRLNWKQNSIQSNMQAEIQADRIVQLKERIKKLERKDIVNEKIISDQSKTIQNLKLKVVELSETLLNK